MDLSEVNKYCVKRFNEIQPIIKKMIMEKVESMTWEEKFSEDFEDLVKEEHQRLLQHFKEVVFTEIQEINSELNRTKKESQFNNVSEEGPLEQTSAETETNRSHLVLLDHQEEILKVKNVNAKALNDGDNRYKIDAFNQIEDNKINEENIKIGKTNSTGMYSSLGNTAYEDFVSLLLGPSVGKNIFFNTSFTFVKLGDFLEKFKLLKKSVSIKSTYRSNHKVSLVLSSDIVYWVFDRGKVLSYYVSHQWTIGI